MRRLQSPTIDRLVPTIAFHHASGPILVVDDHRDARASMADMLRHAGLRRRDVASAIEALRKLADESSTSSSPICDARHGRTGIHSAIRTRSHGEILMITAHASVASAVEAMRRGAFDYIEKPFAPSTGASCARPAHGGRSIERQSAQSQPRPTTRASSEQPRDARVSARIAQIAPTDETVLICGESGTGKELVAQSLHAAAGGRRRW